MRTPLVLALLLLPALASASAAQPEPRLGEAAEYVLTVDGRSQRVFLEWRVEDVWLPSGETRALATLRAIFPEAEPPRDRVLDPWDDAAPVPSHVHTLELHWNAYPGPSAAWSASWADVAGAHHRGVLKTTLGSCAAETAMLAWADASCDAGVRVARRADAWLPLSVRGANWTLELVAWRAGTAPLPAAAGPLLAPPPALPLVPWTRTGPASGDLPTYPFRAATDALAQDLRTAAWLTEHPDAQILQARHTWATSLRGTWEDRAKGAPCTLHPGERVAGAEWASVWLDRDGSLFGIVQQPAEAVEARRVLHAHVDALDATDLGAPPSRLAPAPSRLAQLVDLIPPERGEVASITYDFLPEGAVASVSRGSCFREPATGRQFYDGSFLSFRDGVASSTIQFRKTWDGARLPVGLTMGAAAAAPGGPSLPDGLSPRASATVALGLVVLAGAAALYSRIHRRDALDHAKRARVYAHVQAHPGRSVQELARALGLPRNTVEHHLRTLARTGYVTIRDGPHGKIVQPSDREADPHDGLLAREHARELLELVRAHPGQAQAELARRLGMQKGHLSELVRELEAAGLVLRRRRGRRQEVHPSAETDRA